MVPGCGILSDGLLAMFIKSTTVLMFGTDTILYKESVPEKQMEIEQLILF